MKSLAILAYFGLNLVAMATPLLPWKFRLYIWIRRTRLTLLFTGKKSRYLVQNWNRCNFGLILPKFGCHGNSLCSLENSDSIFEFADPQNPTIHAKDVSISCTEMKLYLFECLAYLYHCNFHYFFAKNRGKYKTFLFAPQNGRRWIQTIQRHG